MNFTPFTDSTTGQNVSFLNLPYDGGVHRDLVTASTIPPAAAGPQTALIGSTYNGTQTQQVSPDTPAKSPADDGSYSAPSGGVLAALNLQVPAGQLGLPLYIDLGDGDPNSPGSTFVVFTGSGAATIELPESGLGDGFHGEGVPCVPVAPPPPPKPTLPPIPTPPPPAGDTPENASHCAEDPSGDNFIDIFDITRFTQHFAQAVSPAPAEYDISPRSVGDGYVDIFDIVLLTNHFADRCIGVRKDDLAGTSPDGNTQMLPPPGPSDYVWGCKSDLAVYKYEIRPEYGGALLTDWGGWVGCAYDPLRGQFIQHCFFEWQSLYPDGWHVVAATSDGTGDASLCSVGTPHASTTVLPCGQLATGYVYHSIRRWSETGPLVHGSHEHFLLGESGYGFNPC